MLWRILILELRQPSIETFKFKSIMEETEVQWRQFSHNGVYPQKFDHIHLMLTDRVASHTFSLKGVDYYFSRALDGTTVFNDKDGCAIYVKFARFIFWGFLSGVDDTTFTGTKINPIKGNMRMAGQQMAREFVHGFYQNRMKQIEENTQYASEKQQEIIEEEILKNKEKYSSSEIADIIQNDEDLYEMNKNK